MHFVELKLCEKVGNILIECQKQSKADRLDLLLAWLASATFQAMIDGDVVLCSQAKSYVAKVFLSEIEGQLHADSQGVDISEDVLFWFGYLITFWCFEYTIKGTDIAGTYDIGKILASYEVYHSLGVTSAIDKIKEDCVL